MVLRTGPIRSFYNAGERDITQVGASWGAGMWASLVESFQGSPGPMLFRSLERGSFINEIVGAVATPEQREAAGQDMLSAEEAMTKFGIEGQLTFEKPIAAAEAQDLYDTTKARLRRESIIARSQIGGFEQFIASLGGAALDPLNLAAGYVPGTIIGWSAKGSTIGARARYGAAEGAIGAATVAPFTYGLAQGEQRPYTLSDAFLDVVFGSALGAGIHAGIGVFKQWREGKTPALPPIQQAIQNLPPRQREAVLRGAVADVVEGRPVGVGPVVTDAVGTIEQRLAADSVLREVDALLERLAPQARREFVETLPLRPEQVAALGPDDARRAVVRGRTSGSALDALIQIAVAIPDNADKSVQLSYAARHETVHALRRLGMFTDEEWSALTSAAVENNWATRSNSTAVRIADEESRAEEAIAEAFALWARGAFEADRLTPAQRARVESLFGRIKQFLLGVLDALQGRSGPEWQRIFADIERGAIGRRERGAPEGTPPPSAIDARGNGSVLSAGPTMAGGAAARQEIMANVARRQLEPYYDPDHVASSEDAAALAQSAPAFRARTDDEPIGSTTQAAEEIAALDEETAAEIAELDRAGVLTAEEKAYLAEADEGVALAQQEARARDMAAVCMSTSEPIDGDNQE